MIKQLQKGEFLMFNIGFTEMLLLAAIALIFIGPKQLPEMARVLGKFVNDLKKTTNEVQEAFKNPDWYQSSKPPEISSPLASNSDSHLPQNYGPHNESYDPDQLEFQFESEPPTTAPAIPLTEVRSGQIEFSEEQLQGHQKKIT